MLSYSGLHGAEEIRAVTLPYGDRDLHVAIVHGLANARKLINEIEEGRAYFDLVEVMTCRGGCVGGAGQPSVTMAQKRERTAGLYETDRGSMIKSSEQNPVITMMYDGPLKGRTHEMLHVHYEKPKKPAK